MASHKLAKWKVHLLFASLLPLAFLLEFAFAMLSASLAREAAIEAIGQLKPFWLLFYMGLWYAAATGRLLRRGERRTDIVTLNLNDGEI